MVKRQVTLPHVDPKVTDPRALSYQKSLHDRMKYSEPRGGAPTPPIPPLHAPHQEGMSMSDNANLYARQGQPPSIVQQPPGHVQGLLPSDILPEEAKSDPEFVGGMGSMLATSQPKMAFKYGVIRNGSRLAPQQLHTGKPGLREQTVAGLEQLSNMQPPPSATRAQESHAQEKREADSEAAGSSAGAAARLANETRSDDIKPMTEEERKKITQRMDEFDWNELREALMKDILNNEDQRKLIEERCQPMDLADLVMHERVSQIVPVVPGKFEPEFESTSGEEELAIKRLIVQEAKSLKIDDQYMLDKYSMMGVALGLRAINKKPMPPHRKQNGDFDEDLFLQKFNRILRLPFHMIASLGVNYYWFSSRVRLLFKAEALKNG